MSLFNKIDIANLGIPEDTLGGTFTVLDSDIYKVRIKAAYSHKYAEGRAGTFSVICDIDGEEYTETLYVSTKEGKGYYVKDGKQRPLAGLNMAKSICALGAEVDVKDIKTELKTLDVYNPDKKEKCATEVEVYPDLTDATLYLAIAKELTDKVEWNGSEYVPTGESRTVNHIQAVFDGKTKQTYRERAEGKDPVHFDEWLKHNKGKEIDRRKDKSGVVKSSGSGSSFGKTDTVENIFSKK